MGCTHGPTPRWHCERGPKASPWRRCPRLAPWPCWGPAIVGRPQDHPWGRAKGGLWMVAFGWPPEVALDGWPLGHPTAMAQGWPRMGGRGATPRGGPTVARVGLPLAQPMGPPWGPPPPHRAAPHRTAPHRTACMRTHKCTCTWAPPGPQRADPWLMHANMHTRCPIKPPLNTHQTLEWVGLGVQFGPHPCVCMFVPPFATSTTQSHPIKKWCTAARTHCDAQLFPNQR